jgi:hypothetical protein
MIHCTAMERTRGAAPALRRAVRLTIDPHNPLGHRSKWIDEDSRALRLGVYCVIRTAAGAPLQLHHQGTLVTLSGLHPTTKPIAAVTTTPAERPPLRREPIARHTASPLNPLSSRPASSTETRWLQPTAPTRASGGQPDHASPSLSLREDKPGEEVSDRGQFGRLCGEPFVDRLGVRAHVVVGREIERKPFSTRFTELVGVPPSAYRRQTAGALAGMPPCVAKQATRPIRNREAPVEVRT